MLFLGYLWFFVWNGYVGKFLLGIRKKILVRDMKEDFIRNLINWEDIDRF